MTDCHLVEGMLTSRLTLPGIPGLPAMQQVYTHSRHSMPIVFMLLQASIAALSRDKAALLEERCLVKASYGVALEAKERAEASVATLQQEKAVIAREVTNLHNQVSVCAWTRVRNGYVLFLHYALCVSDSPIA